MRTNKFLIVVVFVLFISSSSLSPNESSNEIVNIDSFCIEPHISSDTGIKTIERFNLEFSDGEFYLKGYLEPRDDWNENSTISFQFEVDPHLMKRRTEPKRTGFPPEHLKIDWKNSFLSTEFSNNDNDWKNKTYISDFDCKEDQNRKYQIKLCSNENFYKELLREDTKKSLYFEICFDTEDYDKNGNKLGTEGKKEIYLLIYPPYFAVGSKNKKPESIFFTMCFKGKEIEDYYPKEAIVSKDSITYHLGEWIFIDAYIRDNTIYEENVEYHLLRRNYGRLFIIHLTLKDPAGFFEEYAPEFTFFGFVVGLVSGALSILGVQSLWDKIKRRRRKDE